MKYVPKRRRGGFAKRRSSFGGTSGKTGLNVGSGVSQGGGATKSPITPSTGTTVTPGSSIALASADTPSTGITSSGVTQDPIGVQAPDLALASASGQPSTDLPPMLEALIQGSNLPQINDASLANINTGIGRSNINTPALNFRMQPGSWGYTPAGGKFEEGGMVGPGGVPMQEGQPVAGSMPMPQPGGETPTLSPEEMEGAIAQTVQRNPQAIQQLASEMQAAIASGELNADQVNMGLQLCQSALQDPSLYPQLRQYAVQQGLAEEDELPMEYDQGLIFVLILGCRLALGQPVPGLQAPVAAGPTELPSMASGGALPERSPNPGGGIPIMAHEGEYVIPQEVVKAKGTDFFDQMVQKYNGSNKSI